MTDADPDRIGLTIRRFGSRSMIDTRNPESGISHRRTRSILLRGLGLVYLSAFGSLAVQVDGLIGSRGILPAAEYLDRAGQVLGSGAGDLLAAADLALARRVRPGLARRSAGAGWGSACC